MKKRSCLTISSIAFQHNRYLYLQSHLNNIRETDADYVGVFVTRDELNMFFPGQGTDALSLELYLIRIGILGHSVFTSPLDNSSFLFFIHILSYLLLLR